MQLEGHKINVLHAHMCASEDRALWEAKKKHTKENEIACNWYKHFLCTLPSHSRSPFAALYRSL